MTLRGPLDGRPVTFNYRISNGLAEAEGTITVVELPIPDQLQPPLATDDEVTVRVGDAIDIPVLDNDDHPDDAPITLLPELAQSLPDDGGLLFVAGDRLRYLAPQAAGNYTAVYSIAGPDGQTAQARVTMSVREIDAATNNAPTPRRVTARVLAGETVQIEIPLSGVDPDGDSVQLIGIASNPEKGSVLSVGPGIHRVRGRRLLHGHRHLQLQRDRRARRPGGGHGAGRHLAAARGHPQPGREHRRGDRAPGAQRLGAGARERLRPRRQPAHRHDRRAEHRRDDRRSSRRTRSSRSRRPTAEGDYSVIYTIQNESGGTSSAFVYVKVDADAPARIPGRPGHRARRSATCSTATPSTSPVLDNVFFPDGASSELGVALVAGLLVVGGGAAEQAHPGARSATRARSSRSRSRTRTTTASGRTPSSGCRATTTPSRSSTARRRKLEVNSEDTLRIDLNDYVVALGGNQVRLADTSTVRATHANGDDIVVDEDTLEYTSADQYFGPASITFEVTDGSSATDPNGHTAILTLPIDVQPRDNQPPAFNGGTVNFEPGEEKELDLVRLTNYPYDDDLDELVYSVLPPLPDGLHATSSTASAWCCAPTRPPSPDRRPRSA